MARWDLKALREAVERTHGKSQRGLLSPCLESINDRMDFAAYHFGEAGRHIRDAMPGHEADEHLMWMMSDGESYRAAKFQAAAHITACVHNLHAVADTLGQAVYYGLAFNLAKSLKRNPYAKDVLSAPLIPAAVADPLGRLLNHSDFGYLEALSNRGKHYSLVSLPYQVDFTDGQKLGGHGLKFAAFEHKSEVFPEQPARPFLLREYNRHVQLLGEVGNALNAAAGA